MSTRIFETDWLASQPVFYNELTGKASHNINDVIDFNNFEFHPEGLNNYLDLGFSILQQTPIKDVKFLRHSSKLTVHDSGKLEIEYLDDLAEKWIGRTSHEEDVLHLLQTTVNNWEKSVEGEIILPLSGGYDSRLLSLLIEDKSRVRAFTYGVSDNPSKSFEVVNARKVTDILGIKWQQIILGDFLTYFEEWDKLFGVSVHAHGMYHIEFYNKIMPKIKGNNPFLSGNLGDPLAGKHILPEIKSSLDFHLLCPNHGQNATSTMSRIKSGKYLLEKYYIANKEKLADPVFRMVESIRSKLILSSYLLTVPRSFGFKPWCPFIIPEIALSMLTLPPKRRKNRLWQKEFFQKHGIDLESMKLPSSRKITLNYQAMKKNPLKPLDVNLLEPIIKPAYIEWINHHAKSPGLLGKFAMYDPIVRKGLRQLDIDNKRCLTAYQAYLTLKPIENLLKKGEASNTLSAKLLANSVLSR